MGEKLERLCEIGPENYPYLGVTVVTERTSFEVRAYVDTGCEFNLLLPRSYLESLGPRAATYDGKLADGSLTPLAVFPATVQLLGIPLVTPVCCLLEEAEGAEPLLGRGILDTFKACFDGPAKRLTLYL